MGFIQFLMLKEKEYLHEMYKKHTPEQPVICAVFGCGKELSRNEKLYGNKCVQHNSSIKTKTVNYERSHLRRSHPAQSNGKGLEAMCTLSAKAKDNRAKDNRRGTTLPGRKR